eukprot:gene11124-13619_t
MINRLKSIILSTCLNKYNKQQQLLSFLKQPSIYTNNYTTTTTKKKKEYIYTPKEQYEQREKTKLNQYITKVGEKEIVYDYTLDPNSGEYFVEKPIDVPIIDEVEDAHQKIKDGTLQQSEHLKLKMNASKRNNRLMSYERNQTAIETWIDFYKAVKDKLTSYDQAFFNQLLKGLRQRGRYKFCFQVYDHYRELHGDLEESEYNPLIQVTIMSIYDESDQLEKALELFESIPVQNREALHYTVIINAYLKRAKMDEALRWLDRISQDSVKLKTTTFNYLIDQLAKSGQFIICQSIFDQILAKGLKPDSYTITSLLNGLKMIKEPSDQHRLMLDQWISKINEYDIPMDKALMAVILTAYATQSRQNEAIQFFQSIPDRQELLAPNSFSELLHCYHHCPQLVNQELYLLWKKLAVKPARGAAPSTYYTPKNLSMFLHILVESDYPNHYQIVKEEIVRGSQHFAQHPVTSKYVSNTRIKSAIKSNKFEDAWQYFQYAITINIDTIETYNLILDSLIRRSHESMVIFNNCKDILNSPEYKKRLPADGNQRFWERIFNHMIESDNPNGLLSSVELMAKFTLEPLMYHFNILKPYFTSIGHEEMFKDLLIVNQHNLKSSLKNKLSNNLYD